MAAILAVGFKEYLLTDETGNLSSVKIMTGTGSQLRQCLLHAGAALENLPRGTQWQQILPALPMRHPTEGLPDLQARIERELLANIRSASTDLSWLAALLGEGFGADSCAIAGGPGYPVAWWAAPGMDFTAPAVADSCGELAQILAVAEALPFARPWQLDDLDTVPALAAYWRSRLPAARSILGLGISIEASSQEMVGWILLARVRPWEGGWTETLDALSTKLSLTLSCLQQQYWSNRARQARQSVTRICHGATDSIRMQQLSLEALAEATVAERALVVTTKYAQPLQGAEDRRNIPQAKLEVVSCWQRGREPHNSIPVPSPQSLQLADSPTCGRAWQVSPQPLVLSAPVTATDPLFDATASVLLAPLTGRSGGDGQMPPMVLGFLALQRDRLQPWHDWESELVVWAAMQLGTATIYNRTLQRVQGLVDERTAQLQRSLDVQAKLYETSRQQVEQLRQLNLLKDEFLSTISHELNTPLATMRMAIQMLRQPELPAERHERYLSILEQELKRESNLIGDLLTLQQMEAETNPLQPQRLDLKALVDELAPTFAEAWTNKGLKLCVSYLGDLAESPAAILYSEPDSIRRILLELLTNAGKYSDPETEVRLQVSLLPEPPERFAVVVANTGPGIAPSERDVIFEQFRRGRGATQQAVPGTGLGLALVKCLVRHLQGTIAVTGEYCEGTSGETYFTLVLPETPAVG